MLARLALVALLVVPLALAEPSRVEERAYVGPTHPTSARVVSCSVPPPLVVDGACFDLRGESGATVSTRDATGLPVLVHVLVERPSMNAVVVDSCELDVPTPLPPDATRLRVWFPALDEEGLCALGGTATAGTLTVVFAG